jgi:hypothetical protein
MSTISSETKKESLEGTLLIYQDNHPKVYWLKKKQSLITLKLTSDKSHTLSVKRNKPQL